MMTSNFQQLVSMKGMLALAMERKFAIPHINVNNLEWIQAALSAAMQARSPIIIGVSEGAARYMGGYKIVYYMVTETMKTMKCDVPVALHLDHGSYKACLEALDAGFSSIMFDGSSLPFAENLQQTQALIQLCQQANVSLEVEVGAIGGEEDGVSSEGECADVQECAAISKLNIDILAAGIGNIHGLYPDDWKGLHFDLLEEIANVTGKPLVLHGGSGIPDEQVQKAIALGVRKVNVNTECQIAFTGAVYEYVAEHENFLIGKAYDPRKYIKIGKQAIIDTCIEKMKLFNSFGQIK